MPNSALDVKRRIAMANSAFGRMKKTVWSRRDISTKLKLRLYNALILPIAIYGSETWSLTQYDANKLNVFENNCLRAIFNVRLIEYVSIKELRKRAGQHNCIVNIIRKRRLQWFGHVCRMSDECIQKSVLKEDLKGKRRRGRPHKRWLDLIREDTGIPVATAKKYAKDKIKRSFA